MWKWIGAGIGGLFVVNAGVMWGVPGYWYQTVPGVAETGPFNMHFVRDIALAFLVSGVAMMLGALRANPMGLAFGASWPGLHAGFHLWHWAHHGFALDRVELSNLFGIYLPALGAILAARAAYRQTQDHNSGSQA